MGKMRARIITSSILVLTTISVQAQGTGGVEKGGSIPLPAGVTLSFEARACRSYGNLTTSISLIS